MRGIAGRAVLTGLILAAGLGLGGAVVRQAQPGAAERAVITVVNENRGQTIAQLHIQDGTPLQVRYVHSVYRQPAVEEFAVSAQGLELVRLASPSVAVLEYYARPEPVAPAGAGSGAYEIRPTRAARQARLTVLASATGRRTVVYASQELPLHRLAAEGDRIRIAVERGDRPRPPALGVPWPAAEPR
jgi:hypothetical protein